MACSSSECPLVRFFLTGPALDCDIWILCPSVAEGRCTISKHNIHPSRLVFLLRVCFYLLWRVLLTRHVIEQCECVKRGGSAWQFDWSCRALSLNFPLLKKLRRGCWVRTLRLCRGVKFIIFCWKVSMSQLVKQSYDFIIIFYRKSSHRAILSVREENRVRWLSWLTSINYSKLESRLQRALK